MFPQIYDAAFVFENAQLFIGDTWINGAHLSRYLGPRGLLPPAFENAPEPDITAVISPKRSATDQDFIDSTPGGVILAYRQSIYKPAFVHDNASIFLKDAWIDVSRLRKWLARRATHSRPNEPAPSRPPIKEEPIACIPAVEPSEHWNRWAQSSGPTGTSTSSTMHISVPNFAGYGVDTGAYEVSDFSLAGFDANGFDAEGYVHPNIMDEFLASLDSLAAASSLAPVLEDVPLLPPPPPSSTPAPRDEETTIIPPPLPAIALSRSTRARKRADSPPPTVPNPTKKARKRAAALDLDWKLMDNEGNEITARDYARLFPEDGRWGVALKLRGAAHEHPTRPKLEGVELERCVELGRRGVALELQDAALEHQTCSVWYYRSPNTVEPKPLSPRSMAIGPSKPSRAPISFLPDCSWYQPTLPQDVVDGDGPRVYDGQAASSGIAEVMSSPLWENSGNRAHKLYIARNGVAVQQCKFNARYRSEGKAPAQCTKVYTTTTYEVRLYPPQPYSRKFRFFSENCFYKPVLNWKVSNLNSRLFSRVQLVLISHWQYTSQDDLCPVNRRRGCWGEAEGKVVQVAILDLGVELLFAAHLWQS
ncbi:hypothetical protein GGX14DRAFT_405965 [Mycena pura]|uniref:Uncharacterized protein n=1 Tax=Mycena pura TaxID=153505 RepID=A0AAD6UR49_9AGAR|nr:hypothetical protein GGX14DRAFT_405965 [Mycena pura]